jgi:hypothetical protein
MGDRVAKFVADAERSAIVAFCCRGAALKIVENLAPADSTRGLRYRPQEAAIRCAARSCLVWFPQVLPAPAEP